MLAQWTSFGKTRAGVRWGSSPGRPHRSSLSEVQSYTDKDMCGAPADSIGWLEPGLLHRALMDSLEPDTLYYYTVGDLVRPYPMFPTLRLGLLVAKSHSRKGSLTQEYGFSEEFSFRTPPLTSSGSEVQFLAIADLGSAEIDGSMDHTEMLASLNTTSRLLAETEHHQLLIHNGDISYARGFGAIWEACVTPPL